MWKNKLYTCRIYWNDVTRVDNSNKNNNFLQNIYLRYAKHLKQKLTFLMTKFEQLIKIMHS